MMIIFTKSPMPLWRGIAFWVLWLSFLAFLWVCYEINKNFR